ncbi:MAG: hypothetical protein AAGN35_27580 [Bacteroidota bacterium]
MNPRSHPALMSIAVASLLLFCACLRPMDADFGREKAGLADYELLWILQVPLTLDSAEIDDQTTRQSKLRAFNGPFFRDGVTAVVRDVFAEKLTLYPDHDDKKAPVENLAQRLIQMEGDKKDLSPLEQVVELVCVVDLRSSRPGLGKLEFARLIWRYPGLTRADRVFGGLKAVDLAEMEYTVKLTSGEIDLMQFIEADRMYLRPVYLRTNFREYTIRSAEEADFVHDVIVQGFYSRIDWVEDGINISGKQKIELPPDQVVRYNGMYEFTNPADTSRLTVYLTAERDYLVADWTQRFRIEKLMAFADTAFFSHAKEFYYFSEQPDSAAPDSAMCLQYVKGNDTLVGYRVEDGS